MAEWGVVRQPGTASDLFSFGAGLLQGPFGSGGSVVLMYW